MTPRELATIIYRADLAWCKDNAGERRPRGWAVGLAERLWAQVVKPVADDSATLADRVALLESHCSCWKPDVVAISTPSRAELWGRIADVLSVLGHRELDESTKAVVVRVLRGESVAVPDKGAS